MRKIKSEEAFSCANTDISSWESSCIDTGENEGWADIPLKLYEQLQKLEDSPSDESSSCNETSSIGSSSAPLVTFKRSRDDDDDEDMW